MEEDQDGEGFAGVVRTSGLGGAVVTIEELCSVDRTCQVGHVEVDD